MENKEIGLIVEHLEQQSDKLDQVLETLNNSGEVNNNKEIEKTLKKFGDYMNKGFSNYIGLISETYDTHKTHFETLEKKLKPKISYDIKFDRNSRNEFLLAITISSLFIAFLFTGFRYTNDNTNYKKAWSFLMEQDLQIKERSYYNEILKNSK